MTLRLQPDPETAAAWRSFWQLADSRLLNDQAGGLLATQQLISRFSSQHPAALMIAAVDAVADTLVEWADDLGKNPACMAEVSFNMLHSQLKPPERLLLFAASETLLAQDSTGEAGSPHPVCHPWPADAAVMSMAYAGQGEVLRKAIEAAPHTHGLEQQPVPVLCFSVPEVLTHLLWGLSRSDPDRMRELIDVKKS